MSFYLGALEGAQRANSKTIDNMHKVGTELARRIEVIAGERNEAQNKFAEERNERNAMKTHIIGYQSQVDFLMGLLDEAYGVENNPARKSGNINEGDNFTVPCGPREGQEITMADRIFMSAIHVDITNHQNIFKGAYSTMIGMIKKIGLMK